MGDVLLALDAVSKSYWRGATEVRVLDGASLEVPAGELVAVWGKRGAGKTTLLRIAAGLERPDEGTVLFDGEDLARLSEGAHARLMRERVGWVRQASAALRRVGMSDCAGQRWNSLSDGERALVAIAHGIARAPRLLLVDDPTANLGLREREEVLQLLLSLVQETNLAVLMTVPDMPAAMRSHQLRALSGGRLLAPVPPPQPDGNVIDFPRSQRSA
jgi:ABC-type lipoprotein export system ATPase subunit